MRHENFIFGSHQFLITNMEWENFNFEKYEKFQAGSRRSILLTKIVTFVNVIDHVGNRDKKYWWENKNLTSINNLTEHQKY